MELLHVLAGPVIGAVIGYCTNYIAVKMLFRPRQPIMLGGKQLPFTPGIIPRRKAALGAAIGKAVETELFGSEDVKAILAGEECRKAVVDGVMAMARQTLESEQPVETLMTEFLGEEAYAESRAGLQNAMKERILVNVANMNLGGIMTQKAGEIIPQYLANPFVAMFITPELMEQFAGPMNAEIMNYMNSEGSEQVDGILTRELDGLTKKTPGELLPAMPALTAVMEEKIGQVYDSFVEQQAIKIAEQFHIRETVENRISSMSNADLEELVLSVMKKELNAIVNLGALIGFVLGLFNTLF